MKLAPRWYTGLNNKKLFLETLEEVLEGIKIPSSTRGRPPKHPREDYLKLLLIKEEKGKSLREAETDLSREMLGERVDHSIIHYWEKIFGRRLIQILSQRIGELLKEKLGVDFTVIDSTKFTLWNKKSIELHLLIAVMDETLYPISLYLGKGPPSHCAEKTLVPGKGDLYGDRWFDDNKGFKFMFRYGWNPIVKPNRDRSRGYWRRKARKIWRWKGRLKYNQRSRGESPFGSLTNKYGDRLKTLREDTSSLRGALRVVAHQIRILIRVKNLIFKSETLLNILVNRRIMKIFFRHAHSL